MEQGTWEPRAIATRVPLLRSWPGSTWHRPVSRNVIAPSTEEYAAALGRTTGLSSAYVRLLRNLSVEQRLEAGCAAAFLRQLFLHLRQPSRYLQVAPTEFSEFSRSCDGPPYARAAMRCLSVLKVDHVCATPLLGLELT